MISDYTKSYRVMTALRGPDLQIRPLATMKWHITARLRSLCFTHAECHGMYNPFPLNTVAWKELGQAEIDLLSMPLTKRDLIAVRHYLHHLHDAIQETYDHAIWGQDGQTLIEYLNRMNEKLKMKAVQSLRKRAVK